MNNLQRIESFGHDVRYGVRVLMKSPGFLLVALLSLALGIGATTAIFSVVYGVLISPYPYAKPAEIWAPEIRDLKNPRNSRGFYRMRDYVEIKQLPAFAEAMATNPGNRLLTGNRAPENFQSIAVTANAFQFLGVAPAWGRTIQPTDIKSDGQPERVIVLTYKAWQRLFDGSPRGFGTDADAQRSTVHRDRRDAAALWLVDERGRMDRDARRCARQRLRSPDRPHETRRRAVWESSSCRRS